MSLHQSPLFLWMKSLIFILDIQLSAFKINAFLILHSQDIQKQSTQIFLIG